jgi:hypothetical protein
MERMRMRMRMKKDEWGRRTGRWLDRAQNAGLGKRDEAGVGELTLVMGK